MAVGASSTLPAGAFRRRSPIGDPRLAKIAPRLLVPAAMGSIEGFLLWSRARPSQDHCGPRHRQRWLPKNPPSIRSRSFDRRISVHKMVASSTAQSSRQSVGSLRPRRLFAAPTNRISAVGRMYRPVMIRFDGALFGSGFSTISVTPRRSPLRSPIPTTP